MQDGTKPLMPRIGVVAAMPDLRHRERRDFDRRRHQAKVHHFGKGFHDAPRLSGDGVGRLQHEGRHQKVPGRDTDMAVGAARRNEVVEIAVRLAMQRHIQMTEFEIGLSGETGMRRRMALTHGADEVLMEQKLR